MNILVVGGGGREHALAWKIAQSPRVAKVFVAPGNAGTAREPGLTNVPGTAIADLVAFAREGADRADDRRAGGAARRRHRRRVPRRRAARSSAPTKAAAQLESSKDYAKAFMARHGIPTAQSRTFADAAAARAYVSQQRRADRRQGGRPRGGQGRGRRADAWPKRTRRSTRCSSATRWAPPARAWSIEEFLEGEEASFIVMADGRHVLPLASSQDHKRLRDGDAGPEHRRHGRVFAGAGRHAGDARADHARGDPAGRQRHGRRRHSLHRLPVRRRDDRRRRQSEGPGVQLPAGRSGDPADHGAAEVRSRRSRRARRQRHARPRRGRVGPARGARRRARGARLSRQPAHGRRRSRASTA